MKKTLTLFFLGLLFSSLIIAQPANDDCATATDLGTLPTPGACTAGMQTGATVTLNNQSTTGATQANPYMYIGSTCTGGGNLDNVGLDVWYKCTASGNILVIDVTSFPGCQISLFEGTSCNTLIGKACSANGNGDLSIYDAVAGHTYYFKISGDTTSTDNNFTVSVNNNIDCNNCIRAGTITANPLPNNASYIAGDTVNFCFHVDTYAQINTSWLHGVQIEFGNGWDQSSLLVMAPPTYLAASGIWVWQSSCTSSASLQTFGQGFYFEGGGVSTDAGDNFGDGGGTSAVPMTIPSNQWNFCWSIKVDSLNPTQNDLSITINTSGDGESGSWVDPGCAGDSAFIFLATKVYPQNLCAGFTALNDSTHVLCGGTSTGMVSVTPIGGTAPYTYDWGSFGTDSVLNNIPTGTYTCQITDANFCILNENITILETPILQVNITPGDTILCNGDSLYLNTIVSGGTAMYSYAWSTTSTSPYLNTLITSDTIFTIEVYDNNGCYSTDTVNISVPQNYILGNVSDGTVNMITGNVILLDANNPGSLFGVVDTVPMDFLGNYVFVNVAAGNYLVQYNGTDTSILGTYHTNAVLWEDADLISHSCLAVDTANILINQNNYVNNGTSYLSGTVYEGVGYGNRIINNLINTVPGGPLANVRVLLIDSVSGMGLDETTTDASGMYYFANVPIGNYRVVPDIAGLYSDSSYYITVGSVMQLGIGNNSVLNEVYTGLDFYADSNSVYIVPASIGIKDENSNLENITLFPNPASNEINISAIQTIRSVKIIDLLGRVVMEQNLSGKLVNIDIKELQPGNYFIVVKTEGGNKTKLLIKE